MGRLLGAKGWQAPSVTGEHSHTHSSMDGVAGLFQELRLQDLPQLQRQNKEACQQEPSGKICLRLYNLAEAQLKEGKISEAFWTQMQIAEIRLSSCRSSAREPWGWVLGMRSPWEVWMSRRKAASHQAQKVDAEPTLEDLPTPKMYLANLLKELEEQTQAAQKLER